jgi:pseudaminic acid cytidylyltransferase
MIVAIIPARGGSKRIPRKNIKHFAGKPIIAYSIEAAKESKLFDRIIVSTDDPEIASVATSYGAEAPFLRPAELADDYANTGEVIKHAVSWLIEQGATLEYVCCIYATAPFVQANYLRKGYEKLIVSGKPIVFSVTTYPFPIQRAIRLTVDGSVEAIHPEYVLTRSQDLEEIYHDAGQFYWCTTSAILDDVMAFSSASLPVILPRYLVQDIDTPEDWERAEFMFRAWRMMDPKASTE